MKKVKLRVPATVANLVCGFDILGMAIHDPYDEMELKLLDSPDIIIKHLRPARTAFKKCGRSGSSKNSGTPETLSRI